MSKVIETSFVVVGCALMVWFGASFIDVVLDNTTTAVHASWNVFSLLVK